jgi:hypothetical protein
MQTHEAITFFNTQQRLANALGIKAQSSISKWVKKGIPYLRQLQIQLVTKGKLKANIEHAPKRKEVNVIV